MFDDNGAGTGAVTASGQARLPQAWLRDMFDQAPFSVQVFALSGDLLWANLGWERLFGAPRDLAPGNFNILQDPGIVEGGLLPLFERGFAGEQVEIPITRVEPAAALPPGLSKVDHLWVRAVLYPVKDADGSVREIMLLTEDVTERVEQEAALRRREQELEQHVAERTRELAGVLAVSHSITATLELEPLLGMILDELKTVVDFAGASVSLVEGEFLNQIIRRAPTAADGSSLGARVPNDPDHPVHRAMHGVAVIVGDLRGDEPSARAFRAHLGRPIEASPLRYARAWMAVPMMVGERAIGMIALARETPHSFNERHAELVTAIANQAAVAIENARLFGRAQELAVLEERARLARDLHDSVTQSVFSLGLLTRAAQAQHRRGLSDELGQTLDRVGVLAQEALAEMRALLFELRPAALSEEGLAGALEKLVAAVRVRSDLAVSFTRTTDQRLPSEVETAVFRMVQEALTNAAKHAHPSKVEVNLAAANGWVIVAVADDGAGFDSDALVGVAGMHGGMGLRSMRERATAAGLSLTIASTPGKGTRVTIAAPVQGSL